MKSPRRRCGRRSSSMGRLGHVFCSDGAGETWARRPCYWNAKSVFVNALILEPRLVQAGDFLRRDRLRPIFFIPRLQSQHGFPALVALEKHALEGRVAVFKA